MLNFILHFVLPCMYASIGSMCFCFIFNIRGKKILYAAFGGGFGWFVYLMTGVYNPNDVMQYFAAAVAISIYAELFARIHKVPAIVYLVVALIPLVPGSGIYHTMEYGIRGNTAEFMSVGLHTLTIAGAIAMGVLAVTSLIMLMKVGKNYRLSKRLQIDYDKYSCAVKSSVSQMPEDSE